MPARLTSTNPWRPGSAPRTTTGDFGGITGTSVTGFVSEVTPSSETSDVRWINAARLPELPMDRSMRLRLAKYEHYLASGGHQHLG